MEEPEIKRTWMPVAAGVLDIITGIVYLLFVFGFLGCVSFLQNFGDDDYSRSLTIMAAALLPIAIITCLGGIFAMERKIWWMALIGTVVALLPAVLVLVIRDVSPVWFLPFLFLEIIALILLSLSAAEFK
jgi:hypothetical protein